MLVQDLAAELRLAPEAGHELGIDRDRRLQHLDRIVAAQRHVLRQLDLLFVEEAALAGAVAQPIDILQKPVGMPASPKTKAASREFLLYASGLTLH